MTHAQLRKLVWANAFVAAGVKLLETGRNVPECDSSGYEVLKMHRTPAETDEKSAVEFANAALALFDEKWLPDSPEEQVEQVERLAQRARALMAKAT